MSENISIANLRKEYTLAGLRRIDLETDPMVQFHKWFQQALAANLVEPNAMVLATADKQGRLLLPETGEKLQKRLVRSMKRILESQ